MRSIIALGALALIAGGLSAQTKALVSPATYTTAEAPSYSPYPMRTVKCTYQQVHDDLGFLPRIISGLAFRRDKGGSSAYPAFTMTATVRLSNAAVTATSTTSTFATNHGKDMLEVLTKATVNMPAAPAVVTPPAPFTYVLPFATKPFPYTGKGSLCWEMRIHTTTLTSSVNCDYLSYSSSVTKKLGDGCLALGKTVKANHRSSISASYSPPGVWRFSITGYELPATANFMHMVGVNNKNMGPIPLPFDLTFMGGKGCKLYLDPIIYLPGQTDTSGKASTSAAPLTIPMDHVLNGVLVYSQIICMDPPSSSFPLVFTDGLEVTLPTVAPVSRIYKYNDDLATTGYSYPMKGTVTQFLYK